MEDDPRWAAFPVDAVPRPIVLLDERVRIEGGFDDGNSKEAWLGGRIGWSTALPAAVSALLPARGRAHTDRELTITEVEMTTDEFRCDRGPRELPAYRLKVTGMYGSCVILSPEVECWWPRPAADSDGQPGGLAEVEDDDVTVHLWAHGGVLTEFHQAEFQEHDAFVIGRAVTSERAVPRDDGAGDGDRPDGCRATDQPAEGTSAPEPNGSADVGHGKRGVGRAVDDLLQSAASNRCGSDA